MTVIIAGQRGICDVLIRIRNRSPNGNNWEYRNPNNNENSLKRITYSHVVESTSIREFADSFSEVLSTVRHRVIGYRTLNCLAVNDYDDDFGVFLHCFTVTVNRWQSHPINSE